MVIRVLFVVEEAEIELKDYLESATHLSSVIVAHTIVYR